MFKPSKNTFKVILLIETILVLAAIITFQITFDLEAKVIIGHLILVSSITIVSTAISIFLLSISFLKNKAVTKYSIAVLHALIGVFLYITYMLCFFGKIYNSKIYTFELFLAYFKHLNGFIENFSANYVLTYSALFIIPFLLITLSLILADQICLALLNAKTFILKHNFNSPPRYIQINMMVFFLLVGFSVGVLLLRHSTAIKSLYRLEEPIISVYLSKPLQGQYVQNDNTDFQVRKNYPNNIPFKKKNVILIIVDALRSDHLSLFGYNRKTSPFLDSLYKKGELVKVDLSFSVSGASFAGINSILRSKIWSNISYYNFSLQHLLKDQGYKLNFFISGDHTHFYGLKSFYGNNTDFNYYIDGAETKDFMVNDDRLIFEGLKQIDNFNNDPSYFHFHLNSAHQAGKKMNHFRIFTPAKELTKEIENFTNSYDNGILQADNYIKKIFKELTIKGYLQNSLVVITADHGESLGTRGIFGHTINTYTDHLLIPILIYDTDKVAYKNTKYATTVDIAPTIVDRLGLPIPETWEGESLLHEKEKEFSFHQMNHYYAIIQCKNNSLIKYMYNHKTKKEEVYDLKKDLYEKENLIDIIDNNQLNTFREKLSFFKLK